MPDNAVRHHRIQITGDHIIYRIADRIINGQPVFAYQFSGDVRVHRRHLYADHIVAGNEFIRRCETVFARADDDALGYISITIGKGDDFFALFGDDDAPANQVIFTVRDSLKHTLPRPWGKFQRAVQSGADFSQGIIIPASKLAGHLVSEVERTIIRLHCDRYHAPVKIGKIALRER